MSDVHIKFQVYKSKISEDIVITRNCTEAKLKQNRLTMLKVTFIPDLNPLAHTILKIFDNNKLFCENILQSGKRKFFVYYQYICTIAVTRVS